MKLKIALKYPILKFYSWRAKRITKKSRKSPEKYDVQWKFNHAIKHANKILKTTNVQITIKGYDNLPKGVALLTPNHQSNIDPVAIVAAMKKQTQEVDIQNKMCLFLAKEELKKSKVFKNWSDFIECSYIDRRNPRTSLIALDQIAKRAKIQNKYIVIFPEGTRSKDGKIHEFKAGAFRIAKKEYIPIIPVTINNSFKFSDMSRKGKLHVTIIFHPKMKPSSFMTKETKFIAKKVQEIVTKSWVKPEPKAKSEKKDANLLNAE